MGAGPSDVQYCKFDTIFTPDECERIVEMGLAGSLRAGVVWDHDKEAFVENKERRNVLTSYHPRSPSNTWIYDRMDVYFHRAAELWKIAVEETVEDLKFMSYGEGGHFGTWHTDTGSEHARFRKISASIELSERSCFDGGNLEIYPHSLGETLRVQQGGGAFFPSFVPHRVTSIRQGQRYSLVNWISGPPYEVDVAQKFMGGRTNSR